MSSVIPVKVINSTNSRSVLIMGSNFETLTRKGKLKSKCNTLNIVKIIFLYKLLRDLKQTLSNLQEFQTVPRYKTMKL